MNREASEKIGATQWRSTAEVLHWFNGRDRNRRALLRALKLSYRG